MAEHSEFSNEELELLMAAMHNHHIQINFFISEISELEILRRLILFSENRQSQIREITRQPFMINYVRNKFKSDSKMCNIDFEYFICDTFDETKKIYFDKSHFLNDETHKHDNDTFADRIELIARQFVLTFKKNEL